MKRKKQFGILIPILSIGILIGSSGNYENKVAEMQAKIDSLESVDSNHQKEFMDLSSFIETLSDGLDSIAIQENSLFYTNKGKERTIVDRKQLRKNLEMFQQTLSNQRLRIAQLTDSLRQKGTHMSKLNRLIDYLNQQLDSKDKLIQTLRADLEKKNVSIGQLNDMVNNLTEDNTKLTQEIEMRKEAMNAQNDAINLAFLKMGTKKELKDAGLLTGGFMKKKRVNYENLPKDKFMQVDIRLLTELPISSSKPKILSPMPESSYRLVKEGKDRTILRIIDPTFFWSVSNYLIIQTN